MKLMSLFFALFLISAISFAGEKSIYDFSWLDQDKEIYVLQNRKYRKDGRIFLSLGGMKTVSGAFVDSMGGQARAGYFFKENWGVELLYAVANGSKNDTAKGVEQQGAFPFYREVKNYKGGMVVWSPFYGKLNTFNKVVYFDWMFGLGAASISTEDNRKQFDGTGNKTMTEETNTGLLWNSGMLFYINENWGARIDISGIHYKADKARSDGTNKLSNTKVNFSNYDLAFGINYLF